MSSKAWKVGNNIDTDLIIAARYLNDASDENMRAHCMEDGLRQHHRAGRCARRRQQFWLRQLA